MKARRLFDITLWLYAIQRICTWHPLRRLLSRGVAATKPRYRGAMSGPGEKLAKELERDGVTMLPGFLPPETVQSLTRHLQGLSLNERFAPFRKGFTIDSVPPNVHVAEYRTDQILACPEVLAIANDPRLVEAAARYLGCQPTISSISIWWSLPADGVAQEAENFHRDVDDWRFVKFFAYLTDVDVGSGAHCYVRGSHRSPRFLRKRRIPDGEVAAAFNPADLLEILGRTGDAFLEDTFGLHRGKPPVSARRLALQVEYSVGPIAVYEYNPLAAAGGSAPLDAYMNRLYVRQADSAA